MSRWELEKIVVETAMSNKIQVVVMTTGDHHVCVSLTTGVYRSSYRVTTVWHGPNHSQSRGEYTRRTICSGVYFVYYYIAYIIVDSYTWKMLQRNSGKGFKGIPYSTIIGWGKYWRMWWIDCHSPMFYLPILSLPLIYSISAYFDNLVRKLSTLSCYTKMW